MQEKLSALMDGEWDDHELAELIASIDEDDACAESWHEYHLIGDAMHGRPVLSDNFLANFSARLEAEPTILAPNAMKQSAIRRDVVRQGASMFHMRPHKRWVAFSMAASVALVSATAWYVGNGTGVVAAPQAQFAANQAIKPAVDEVNPYLVAHQALLGNPGFNHRAVVLTGAEAERGTARH
ncbi:hypothetical protein FNU76_03770 [Chitinimonas arctica]|uniref:Anti sigma-E protein RseA N-terminal domain-containing protein n=1 Tax=Chitinimonas arctica TaxID=2594795 RepID=A0A516SBL5_9NEIS|nr:sigma-E factor negative regulatory protein [Chitinimonas arctica]QDQ25541.1 hypothetical protein FNU76_03770 [Chitinimonas arctica]